jgi:hypothetical protein
MSYRLCGLLASGIRTTTAGHTLFINTRCCEYSLIELLMMGVGYARNMYSDWQEIIKYCTKCHLVGTFLKLIHDARNDKHKITNLLIFQSAQHGSGSFLPILRSARLWFTARGIKFLCCSRLDVLCAHRTSNLPQCKLQPCAPEETARNMLSWLKDQ